MNEQAIFHQPYGTFAYALGTHTAKIILRAARGDLTCCRLVYEDRYGLPGERAVYELSKVCSDRQFDYFTCDIKSGTRRLRYRFYLNDGKRPLWYGEGGVSSSAGDAGWFQLAYLCTRDLFEIPEWASDAIVYQIFPDRFENGDKENDPEGVLPWGQKPAAHTCFGGDLQGIIDRLPYLEDLGVNVLYLTPVFASPSTHKYDTTNYFQIDPSFVDLETCKALVKEAHDRGIRVIFDAVFNHCGMNFAPFQDVIKKGSESSYVDWFHLHGLPVDTKNVNYETFANGIATMPKLRTETDAVRQYLLNVGTFWIREVGIDGWRLDVANEVDHAFWREFRAAVRREKKDALIIGEVWHDASPWLQGDQFDGVMNYLFRDAVIDFFATGSADAQSFDERLARVRMTYKEQANLCMFNLLSSHDTARFLTLAGGDVLRVRLAATFQLTYIGIPEIYYGDELGMEGETDPDCRRTMIWDERQQNRELLAYHKTLIALRKQYKALRIGDYRTLTADPMTGLYVYARTAGEEQIIVCINNSADEASWTSPWSDGVMDLLTDEAIESSTVVIAPYTARILAEK